MKLQAKQNSIPSNMMLDGQVGEIVESAGGIHNGKLVQRFGESLVHLQNSSANGWSIIPDTFKIRILQKGETLIIE